LRGAILRPRLLACLDEARSHRLTLVIAPAGYGKTTLLSQWAGRQPTGEVAWYTLEEQDADLPWFLAYLSAALAPMAPEAAARAQELLTGPEADLDRVLPLLLDGLAALRRFLFLILDDVHCVEESHEVMRTLDRLLRHAPPYLRLVISARQEPPLASVPRLRAMGQVMELTEADLCFTPDDVAHLSTTVFHLALNEETAAQLAERTEGWAVALQLAYQTAVRYGTAEAERILRRFGGTTRQLYDYLMHGVLDGQPADLRAFLRRTSVLERLEPALCDALLRRNDSAAVLARLEQAGLFTFPLDLDRTAYRYHALFREFLLRRLQEMEGTDAACQLHRRAAAWFLERGDDEQAIVHLLAAGDYQSAADLIRPLRKRLFATGRYHLLERWLQQFPPTIGESHPWLLLTRARLFMLQGDRIAAERLYREAEPLLQARQDAEGLYILYHDLAYIVRSQQGDFVAAEELERQALRWATTEAEQATALGVIARCRYMTQGPVPEVFSLLEQAMDLARASGHPVEQSLLFSQLGRLHSSLGDLAAAVEDFHRSLELMESSGNRYRLPTILCNAAYHHVLLGQWDQAEPLIQRALELARIFRQEHHYAYALNLRGLLRRERGNLAAARRDHEEALAIQQRLRVEYEIAVTLNWLGLLARREGRLEEALRYGQEGLAIREKLGTDYETGLSLIDVGATNLALGRLEQAETMWQRALNIYTRHQGRYEQAQLHFYLAVLAHRKNDADGLQSHLSAALDLAQRYGYDYLFVQDSAWAAPLLVPLALHAPPFALRHMPFVTRVLSRLGRPAFDALIPALEDPAPVVRARAAALLGCLRDAAALKPLAARRRDPDPDVRRAVEEAIAAILSTPPPPLRVQTLGRFRLWRGDEEITRWERSAARAVFQYLLTHRPRPVPMEVLMETFWPGSEPAKARKNLHQAVASLRRALEPELAAGLPSRYLQVEEGTYTLVLPAGSWVDHEEFEERVRSLLKAENGDPEEWENVLALYQGDYLPEALYEDWAALPRERLRELYLRALERLSELHLKAGRHQEAAATARRIVEQDPWSEEATRLLMQAHERSGDIPAALRAYEVHRERLQRDLGLPPREDLTALYERLRSR